MPPQPAERSGDDDPLRAGLRAALSAIQASHPRLSPQDTEDIMQELAVLYLENPTGVRNPEAWFSFCALRRARKLLSEYRLHLPIDETHLADPEDREAEFLARKLLATLNEDSRRLLIRLYIAGFTLREIATAEGRSLRSVQRQLARALDLLRARYAPRKSV